jgi:hypothetical protein
MAFTLRPFRRFPVQCDVTNNVGIDPTTRYGPVGFWGCGHPLQKRSRPLVHKTHSTYYNHGGR